MPNRCGNKKTDSRTWHRSLWTVVFSTTLWYNIYKREREETMDELVKTVSNKVGISEAQAKQAVDIVLGFLQDKLPPPVAGQLDAALKGDVSGLDDLVGGLGGMFGKKQ
jgi:hypothetical protein